MILKLSALSLSDSSRKIHAEKCHAFVLGKEIILENFTIQVGNAQTVPEHEVTLLRVTLDSKLNFNTHINNILKELSKKFSAPVRIAKYSNKSQKTLLSGTFVCLQFNYCPFV